MFGTLVIALPTKHEGGEIYLENAAGEMTIETSENSAFGTTLMAWFDDQKHEVKPILSGHLLVLIYKILSTNEKKVVQRSDKVTREIRSLLVSWKEALVANAKSPLGGEKDIPGLLAYPLEHKYHDNGLTYSRLKGHDKRVYSYLLNACKKAGFDLYLGNFGVDGTNGWRREEIDREAILYRVVDVDGRIVAEDIDFDEQSFLKDHPFKEKETADLLKRPSNYFSYYNELQGALILLIPKESSEAYFRNMNASPRPAFKRRSTAIPS